MSAHDLSLSMVPILTSCYHTMFSIWDPKLHNSVDMFHLVLKTVLKIGKLHRNLWISNFYWKIRVDNIWPALAPTAVSRKPAIATAQGEHAPLRLPFRSAPACVDHLVQRHWSKNATEVCQATFPSTSLLISAHFQKPTGRTSYSMTLPHSPPQSALIHSQTFIEGLPSVRQ